MMGIDQMNEARRFLMRIAPAQACGRKA